MEGFFLFVSVFLVSIISHGSSFLHVLPYHHQSRTRTIRTFRLFLHVKPPSPDETPGNVMIFGNGNVGKAVLSCIESGVALRSNNTIYCTFTKSPPPDKIAGVEYIQFNQTTNVLQRCSHVLITIPPIMKDDNYNFTDPILDNPRIFSSIPKNAWIGYVSTTGVYGNHNGEWVNESSLTLCKPGTKARAYLDIERRWHAFQNTSTIFRCGGLYGENVSALHTVRKGRGGDWSRQLGNGNMNENGKEEGVTSRIHLVDVGRAIVAGMKQSQSMNGVFNLADSLPAARSEVMHYAYNLLLDSNVTPEKHDANVQGSERRRRRGKDRKRVSNQKMLHLLEKDYGGKLLFPSYRAGLQHVLSKNLCEWKSTG
jgi:nucleoside-diphosphate-sugar epimerase